MTGRPLRDALDGLQPQRALGDLQRAPERVRVAAAIRADWLRQARPQDGLQALLEDWDDPAAEAVFHAAHPLAARLAELAPPASPDDSEVSRLATALTLVAAEVDLIDLLLAAAIDPALGVLFETLGRAGRPAATAALCARLFGHGRTLLLTETSGLRLWGLVEEEALSPGEPPALALDPRILARLCGRGEPAAGLAAVMRNEPPNPPLAGWPVAETARVAFANLGGAAPRPVRLVVRGQTGGGRTTFARAVAAELGLPLLALEADAVPDEAWATIHRLANRQAFLDEAAIAWRGRSLAAKPWPGRHPRFPIEVLILEPGQPAPPAAEGAAELEVILPSPDPGERRTLWLHHSPAAVSWPAGDLERLAAYEVQPAEIAAVARRHLPDADACIGALRVNLPDALREFAELPDCTFRWKDLVVAAPTQAALEEFTFEARERAGLWRKAEPRRLFPQGRAVVGLFSGAPGTGKTMAAQVIAADLGLTLCRVNLATITSKWVGETSQRVDALFRFCSGRNTLLLIDEADALCGKRIEEAGDAQDAHVNRDISHLMMAIENHEGVIILTTNLKGNLDPAFLRRIRHSLEFRKPTADERRELWAKMVGGLCGEDRARALRAKLGPISEIEATGAQIKNAVLSAHFAALRDRRPVGLAHLVAGIDREFRKEGYGLAAGQIAEASRG